MPRTDEVDLRNEAAAAGQPIPRPTNPLGDMAARLQAMSAPDQEAFRRWVDPNYRQQQMDRALPPSMVEDRNAYLNAKREARQQQIEQQQRRMAEIEVRRQQVQAVMQQINQTPATVFQRQGAAGVRALQSTHGFQSDDQAREALMKPQTRDEYARAKAYFDERKSGVGLMNTIQQNPLYQAARTEIPYADKVANFAGEQARAMAENPATPIGLATHVQRAALSHLPGPNVDNADIAQFAAESFVPTEAWMAALELVPGIGTVPDLITAARAGAPEVLTALAKTADNFAEKHPEWAAGLRRMASEYGGGPVGGPLGMLPEKAAGEAAPEIIPAIDTPEGAVQELNRVLRTVEKLKPEQYQARSAERAARIGEFNARVARGEDVTAAKAALGGELPKARFDAPQIKPEVVKVMRDHIARGDWTKSGYYRINADDALAELMMGVIPADSKLARLQEAFNITGKEGDELVKLLMDKRSLGQKAYAEFVGALGLPQAFMSTLDASAVFRQTGVMGAGNPREWARSVALLKKVSFSQSSADEAMAAILEHPWMSGEIHPGYGFLELGGRISHIGSVGEREGQFAAFNQSKISRTVEKLPHIRASERAYNLPINKLRQEVYAKYAQNMWDLGERDPAKYKALINVIDHGTGWSDVKLGEVVKGVNAFFSPRMFAARFQVLLDPILQPGSLLQPSARQLAARNLVGFASANAALLGLLGGGGALAAKTLGIDNPIHIELDPRSTDWGKAKIGNMRVDMTGGYGSILRLLYQIAPAAWGGDVKVKTGAGLVKPGDVTELTKNFLRGKLGPVPGMVWDAFIENGNSPYSTNLKSKEGIRTAAYNNFVPFIVQDVVEAWRNEGPGAAGLAAPISFFGGSVNTYELSDFSKKEQAKAESSKQIEKLGARVVESKPYPKQLDTDWNDDPSWAAGFAKDMPELDIDTSKPLGKQYKNIDELKAAYIEYWWKDHGIDPAYPSEKATKQRIADYFDSLTAKERWTKNQQQERLDWWRSLTPEQMAEVRKAGIEPNATEKKALGIR